jgi:UrcA family protein
MTTRSKRTLSVRALGASLAVISGLAIGGAAAAQTDQFDHPPSVNVAYGDLNLQSQAGAKAMLSRLEGAATDVCGGEPDIHLLDRQAIYQRCRAEAVDRAVRTMDAPLVTAMAGQSGATIVLAGR